MLDKLKGIFGKNKKELKKIEEKKDEYATFSRDALTDRKDIILETNELIDSLDDASNKYEEGKKTGISPVKLGGLKRKISEIENEIKRKKQGKFKSLIGTYFGQIDKKIHNFLYFRENLSSDRLWDFHCDNVHSRYENLPGYILKNGFAVLLITALSMFVSSMQLFSTNIVSTILMSINGLVTLNAGAKALSTVYNKKKFGGPLLRQYEPLLSGSYKENILNARFALAQGKELASPTSYTQEIPKLIEENKNITEENSSIEEKTKELVEELVPEETIEEIQEELVEPNINDYGNINLGIFLPNIKSKEIPYSKAVSSLRRTKISEASDEEYEKKIASYAKLYDTYGKSKPKKKKSSSDTKLNDYNKTLKLLAEYGRKVHSGTATQQEVNTYWGLLYHLGKDDDFIGDFLADEYDRYQEDKKQYEEKKLIKKI